MLPAAGTSTSVAANSGNIDCTARTAQRMIAIPDRVRADRDDHDTRDEHEPRTRADPGRS